MDSGLVRYKSSHPATAHAAAHVTSCAVGHVAVGLQAWSPVHQAARLNPRKPSLSHLLHVVGLGHEDDRFNAAN